jgi:hypothetical protein
MISTHGATGSLVGPMRGRTPSFSTAAAVPGVESSPASPRRAKDLHGRPPAAAVERGIVPGDLL